MSRTAHKVYAEPVKRQVVALKGRGEKFAPAREHTIEPCYDHLEPGERAEQAEHFRDTNEIGANVMKISGHTAALKSALVVGANGRNWSKAQTELRALSALAGQSLELIGRAAVMSLAISGLLILSGCGGDEYQETGGRSQGAEQSVGTYAAPSCSNGHCRLK